MEDRACRQRGQRFLSIPASVKLLRAVSVGSPGILITNPKDAGSLLQTRWGDAAECVNRRSANTDILGLITVLSSLTLNDTTDYERRLDFPMSQAAHHQSHRGSPRRLRPRTRHHDRHHERTGA